MARSVRSRNPGVVASGYEATARGIDGISRTELLAQRRLVDLAGGVARQGMTNLIRRRRLKRARLASQWA
jgi:hypothetical protein